MSDRITILEDVISDLNSRMTRDNLETAERKVLDKMDEIKNRESLRGESPAKGGRWNNVYNKQYARREKGGRRSPVTLRNNRRRIEKTTIKDTGKASELRFRDREAAKIFFYHDSGTAKGGKYRQVYPISDSQVPQELDIVAANAVLRILR